MISSNLRVYYFNLTFIVLNFYFGVAFTLEEISRKLLVLFHPALMHVKAGVMLLSHCKYKKNVNAMSKLN